MRVLLIDDDQNVVDAMSAAFAGSVTFTCAASRSTAESLLDAGGYDLVICDLLMPAAEGEAEKGIEQGLAIYGRLVTDFAGTPVIMFSAFGTVEIVTAMLRDARRDDPFGDGTPIPMIEFFKKADLPELVARVNQLRSSSEAVAQVEVSPGLEALDLSPAEKRAIQIYARRRGGVVAHVRQLAGGLSGSRTLRVNVRDQYDGPRSLVVAKLDRIERIDDERSRYGRVGPGLPAGVFAPLQDTVRAGAGPAGALFYSVAGAQSNLFDLVAHDPAQAAVIVRSLAGQLAGLRTGAPAHRTTVADVRICLTDDAAFATIAHLLTDLPVADLEASVVQVRTCLGHGDLHGANVLVDGTNPMIIDYVRISHQSDHPFRSNPISRFGGFRSPAREAVGALT